MRRESSVLWPQGEDTCDEEAAEAAEEEQRQRAGLRALLAEVSLPPELSCTRNHAHLPPTSPQKVSVLREFI